MSPLAVPGFLNLLPVIKFLCPRGPAKCPGTSSLGEQIARPSGGAAEAPRALCAAAGVLLPGVLERQIKTWDRGQECVRVQRRGLGHAGGRCWCMLVGARCGATLTAHRHPVDTRHCAFGGCACIQVGMLLALLWWLSRGRAAPVPCFVSRGAAPGAGQPDGRDQHP